MTSVNLLLVAALFLPVLSLAHTGSVYGEIPGPDRTLMAQDPSDSPARATLTRQWPSPPPMLIDPSKSYIAVISTTLGDIEVALLAEEAPITVNNFVFLAREGFYDGVPFHRIIRNFMVQTGDPTGIGTGGPGYRFEDEPVTRNYTRGTVAMANAGPNTNGSQFFIVHGEQVQLPPNYTIFGTVTNGLDVLDSIASVPVAASRGGEMSSPTVDVRITQVSISEQ